jgi:hypothetical protein
MLPYVFDGRRLTANGSSAPGMHSFFALHPGSYLLLVTNGEVYLWFRRAHGGARGSDGSDPQAGVTQGRELLRLAALVGHHVRDP